MVDLIERDSPVPYYEQLFSILRSRLERGVIAAEERLPSELELCREFGLSRATVRQTMSKLESEGYARRVPRRGVFASSPEMTGGWTVQEGFLESQIRHGRTGITTVVTKSGFVLPPLHAAEALHLDHEEPVFELQRVRSLDGRLAMFSTNWFPGAAGRVIAEAADVLDGSASVNETLGRAGHVVNGARRVVRAMRAPSEVAAHLQIGADEPILRVRSTSWAGVDRRFDYYETWVLTDLIPLEVEVTAS